MGGLLVAQALRAADPEITVVAHDDVFPQDTPDEDWLPLVGERQWILITKDQKIRKHPLQKRALLAARVRAFFFTGGNITGPEMAEIVSAQLPSILKLAAATSAPFLARITGSGQVGLIS
jgi:hypothetical protein